MALAGIELKYIVNYIDNETEGYYVSNIYGIDRDSILFKLHHPDKPDILLVLSTSGVWITSTRITQIEENRLVRRLRSDLLRLKLKSVEQVGLERIAYLKFGGFDKEFVVVGEFFKDGNIILCNDKKKVLALQHSVDVRHRSISVGQEYTQPPQNGLDALDLKLSDFDSIKDTKMVCARWLGRQLGLPRRYAEGIPYNANIEPSRSGDALSKDEITLLYNSARQIISDVIGGRHAPTIWKEGGEAYPIKLGEQKDLTAVDSFMVGLDVTLTQQILQKGRESQGGESSTKVESLKSQLNEQKRAIQTVTNRSASITNVANSLYTILSQGILRLDAKEATEMLAQNGAILTKEKGMPILKILDEKIKINLDAPLQSTASTLYTEAKRQSAAIKSIEKIMEKTRKKIERATDETQKQQESVTYAQVRKKNWFERYRWFFTTDGSLAIGGRDAPSNSAVVRRHMKDNDFVFHAEIYGSPFFILKEEKPTNLSLEEVAEATICFSRVWREGMYGVGAYWVHPDQVKKSAPSGQYLPKGSFTIEGQRNFIKAGNNMKLAVGMIQYEGDSLLTCGPPNAISKHSDAYVVIEPTGLDMVDAAKKIRNEFLRMKKHDPKEYTIDDYVRILPAGSSRILHVHDA